MFRMISQTLMAFNRHIWCICFQNNAIKIELRYGLAGLIGSWISDYPTNTNIKADRQTALLVDSCQKKRSIPPPVNLCRFSNCSNRFCASDHGGSKAVYDFSPIQLTDKHRFLLPFRNSILPSRPHSPTATQRRPLRSIAHQAALIDQCEFLPKARMKTKRRINGRIIVS